MKLFVPACGDRIVLSSDWTFTLYNERRNWSFMESIGLAREGNYTNYGKPTRDHTIEAGTVLECDRIYIRAFSKSVKENETDFDSITWKVVGKKNGRFWAKLKDCNNIEFTLAEDANFKERKKAEEELAKALPQKLDANIIRNMMYYKDGVMTMFRTNMTPAAELLFEDSEKFFRTLYDEHVAHVKELNAKASSLPGNYFSRFRRDPDTFKQLQKQDFLHKLFSFDSSDCKFSRRSDGTCVRKFSWPWRSEPVSYWSYDMTSLALQGLHVNVLSNADDTEVIGLEVCDKRAPKKSK